MSNSLFFLITTVYIIWVAISGAKAKQKREINAAKLNQPVLTDIDKIALAENAAFAYADMQPAYEQPQAGQHLSHDHEYGDTSVSSDTSEHNADLKNLSLAYEREQKQVV